MTNNSALRTNIYVLSAPDGAVRYVGKTVLSLAERLSQHLSKARRGKKGHTSNWIRSLGDASPEITLLHVVVGPGWAAAESALIAGLRGAGYALTNKTDGGEGAPGYRHTPSARALVSEALKKRVYSAETRANMSAAQRGHETTAATRARISKAQKGKKRGPRPAEHVRRGFSTPLEVRLKQSLAQKGRKISEETRERLRTSHTGKTASEATRQRMREAQLSRIDDIRASLTGRRPSRETVEKRAAKVRGTKQTPESVAKRRATRAANKAQRLLENPGYVAVTDKMRAAYAARKAATFFSILVRTQAAAA